MNKEPIEVRVPDLDPLSLKIKAIVKVFITQYNNSDGYWSDCGAGEASFIIDSKLSSLDHMLPKDIGIVVRDNLDGNQQRDYLSPERESNLRGGCEDEKIILSINFEHAKDFSKS